MSNTLSRYENNLPGSILKDMAFFLKFIQENNLEITGNKGLLPNHCLPLINVNMSHSLKLRLKREQQMSYPHISGLYLLSRTLGLIEIRQNKSKRYLSINEKTVAQWEKLNTTEKYFSFMYTWFFKSDERLINQGRHSGFFDMFFSVIRFMDRKLTNPLIFENEKNKTWWLYSIKTYNLALMEMFGMVDIEDNEQVSEKSWSIAKVSLTDFGKQWSNLFNDNDDLTDPTNIMINVIHDKSAGAELFYQKLRQFFPQWKICFESVKKKTDNGAYFFKIYFTKKVWRRISIQGSDTMDSLADSIFAYSDRLDH